MVLLLWLLSPILLPFVLGMALGYFLDPVVGWLDEQRGLSRSTAAGALIFGFVGVGALATIVLTPILVAQAADLARTCPTRSRPSSAGCSAFVAGVMAGMRHTPAGDLTAPLTDAAQRIIGGTTGLITNLVTQGLAVINVLTLLAVTPLVAFYLLRDWPRIVTKVDSWLPRAYADTIRAQCREIDRVLAGFAAARSWSASCSSYFYAFATHGRRPRLRPCNRAHGGGRLVCALLGLPNRARVLGRGRPLPVLAAVGMDSGRARHLPLRTDHDRLRAYATAQWGARWGSTRCG